MQIFRRGAAVDPTAIDDSDDRLGERRLRVMMVDENPTARTVIARRLSHLDYDVVLAENGYVALNLMATQNVDAILIDMGMTLMSGIATMKKIRASGLAGHACFILITGRTDSLPAVEALRAGADDHVAKPFDFGVLDARLRHACARAAELDALGRRYAEMDARVARRAMELGETRETLRDLQADRNRLVASIQALHDEIERLSATRG